MKTEQLTEVQKAQVATYKQALQEGGMVEAPLDDIEKLKVFVQALEEINGDHPGVPLDQFLATTV